MTELASNATQDCLRPPQRRQRRRAVRVVKDHSPPARDGLPLHPPFRCRPRPRSNHTGETLCGAESRFHTPYRALTAGSEGWSTTLPPFPSSHPGLFWLFLVAVSYNEGMSSPDDKTNPYQSPRESSGDYGKERDARFTLVDLLPRTLVECLVIIGIIWFLVALLQPTAS